MKLSRNRPHVRYSIISYKLYGTKIELQQIFFFFCAKSTRMSRNQPLCQPKNFCKLEIVEIQVSGSLLFDIYIRREVCLDNEIKFIFTTLSFACVI